MKKFLIGLSAGIIYGVSRTYEKVINRFTAGIIYGVSIA